MFATCHLSGVLRGERHSLKESSLCCLEDRKLINEDSTLFCGKTLRSLLCWRCEILFPKHVPLGDKKLGNHIHYVIMLYLPYPMEVQPEGECTVVVLGSVWIGSFLCLLHHLQFHLSLSLPLTVKTRLSLFCYHSFKHQRDK